MVASACSEGAGQKAQSKEKRAKGREQKTKEQKAEGTRHKAEKLWWQVVIGCLLWLLPFALCFLDFAILLLTRPIL
jgi:hypothetical protein